MGTSTMGSDLHSEKLDKQQKLQARKKELEILLAAKNEELYKLCVQEVQLTGVMPPEAPLSPEVPRERLGSIRSSNDGDDVRDSSDLHSRRPRAGTGDRTHDDMRKHLSHRLSTPSISGTSTKSAPSRHRRPETSCSNFFPSPPQDRSETFSIHNSHTFPALAGRHDNDNSHSGSQSNVAYKQHTTTTEYMNKIYYSNAPEGHNVTSLRETHFSSSHPDITTNYNNGSQQLHPNNMRPGPLLYQYASQLKAQNHHLGSLAHHHQMPVHPKRRQEGSRRNPVQRTPTYHSSSHIEYNHHLENLADSYRSQQLYPHRMQDIQSPPTDRIHIPERIVPNTLPLRERNIPRNPVTPLQVHTEDYPIESRCYPEAMSPVSQISGYSQSNFDSVSMNKYSPQTREKHWYESSLDSPTQPEIPPKKSNLKRTSSIGNSQAYEVMMSSGPHAALQSPQLPSSPPVMSPNQTAPLDSPVNVTVIEQGKCIPYREESKPFEMSDFYKYSTKFRQGNNNVPKPNMQHPGYNKMPRELPKYGQENWHGQND